MRTASRWRRALLGALMATCVLLGLTAPAWAEFDLSTDRELTIDSDTHWWNSNSGWGTRTYGAYQYLVYWDAPDVTTGKTYVKITRRKLSDNSLLSIRFDGTGAGEERTTASELVNLNDGHDYVAVGVSPNDGRVHISWSSHHAQHHYAISNEGCLSQATFSQANCRFTWSTAQIAETRDTEERGREIAVEGMLTYPVYFNDNSGKLYMAYRFGESTRGTEYVNTYQDNGRWTTLGRIFYGRRGSGRAEWDVPDDGRRETPDPATSEERGPYPQGWRFDKNERLHVMWLWKEHLTDHGNPDYVHGTSYAYSDDHGRTWNTSEGRAFATAETDPILVSDTEALVFSAPVGSFPSGGEMELESNNRPHLVFAMADGEPSSDALELNLRQRHLWQGTDGTWYSSWVQSAEEGAASFGGLLFDGADSAYLVFNRNMLDWMPWDGRIYDQLELQYDRVTWQGGEYLDVQQQSAITCLDTVNNINTTISREGNSQIRLSLNNNTDATEVELFFSTRAEKEFTAEHRVVVPVTANDRTAYRSYTVDLSRTEGWSGTLRSLEICMNDPRADAGDQFRLDYVRVTDSRGREAKSWEFREGVKMMLAESAATTNWGASRSSWIVSELLPGVSDTWPDGAFIIDKQRYKDSRKVDFLMTTQGVFGTESVDLHEFDVVEDTVRKEWRFDISAMEWTAVELVSELRWSAEGGTGALTGTITGNDSAIDSARNLSVELGTASRVNLRMKQSAGTQAMLCWVVDDRVAWNINRCSRPFEVRANGRYNTYEIATREWRDWSGHELTQLRLEPSDTREVTSGTFNVDYIRIFD